MDFFFDNMLPQKLARMLSEFDRSHNVEHLRDGGFAANTPDAEWLGVLAKRKPVPFVVTVDQRMLRNPAEAAVLSTYPVSCFFFASAWSQQKWETDLAWKAVKVWPMIVSAAERARVRTFFEVPISGKKVDVIPPTRLQLRQRP